MCIVRVCVDVPQPKTYLSALLPASAGTMAGGSASQASQLVARGGGRAAAASAGGFAANAVGPRRATPGTGSRRTKQTTQYYTDDTPGERDTHPPPFTIVPATKGNLAQPRSAASARGHKRAVVLRAEDWLAVGQQWVPHAVGDSGLQRHVPACMCMVELPSTMEPPHGALDRPGDADERWRACACGRRMCA